MNDTQIWVWIIVAVALAAILGLAVYSFIMNRKMDKNREELLNKVEKIRKENQDGTNTVTSLDIVSHDPKATKALDSTTSNDKDLVSKYETGEISFEETIKSTSKSKTASKTNSKSNKK